MTKSEPHVKQRHSQGLYQTIKNKNGILKNCWANKFSKTTIAIFFNLLQVCPSVPPFVFTVLFTCTLPFHVLRGQLFTCFTQFVTAVPTQR